VRRDGGIGLAFLLAMLAGGASARGSSQRRRGTAMRAHHGNTGRVSGTGHASAVELAHAPAAIGTGAGWPTWPRTRYAAALRALPPEVPDARRADVALALVAHFDLETDGGNAEWGGNVGNIRRFPRYAPDGSVHGDAGPAQTLADGLPYRRYASPDDGVRDYVALVSHAGYARPVWLRLLAGELSPGAYAAELANAGYSRRLTSGEDAARRADVDARAREIRAALSASPADITARVPAQGPKPADDGNKRPA